MKVASTVLLVLVTACAPRLLGIVPSGQRLSLDVSPLGEAGEELHLQAGRRHLVVFWASWCARCRPAVQRTRALTGVVVHAVSVDADPRMASATASSWGIEHWWWDREARAATRLGVRRLPTLVLTDRAGRIRHVFEGWDESVEARLHAAIAAGGR